MGDLYVFFCTRWPKPAGNIYNGTKNIKGSGTHSESHISKIFGISKEDFVRKQTMYGSNEICNKTNNINFMDFSHPIQLEYEPQVYVDKFQIYSTCQEINSISRFQIQWKIVFLFVLQSYNNSYNVY